MKKKRLYYNIDSLAAEGSNWNLAFGEKSNGKSYQIKHKKGILPALEDLQHNKFFYLRRYKDEISTDRVERYFADIDIEGLTGGEYNTVTAYKKQIYLCEYNLEAGINRKGPVIGYYGALSTEQNMAGGSFLDVNSILFEEFMSRTNYLKDETYKLHTLYSTIDRKEQRTKVWMVGNSITRVCPYFYSWGLDELIRSMNQGDIVTVPIDVRGLEDVEGLDEEDKHINLSLEYCKNSGGKGSAFGDDSSIDSGKWKTDPQPHLDINYKSLNLVLRVGFEYKRFKFIGECRYYNNSLIWMIYPKYSDWADDNTLIFTDRISPSVYIWPDPYHVNINNVKLQHILSTFIDSKIFYSDDLCGTDFKQAINFIIKK